MKSNIGDVIGRLKSLPQRIEDATASVMDPKRYRADLVRIAYQSLDSMMTPDEEPALHTMIGTIAGAAFERGMLFTMSGISIERLGVPQESSAGLMQFIGRDEVLDWVKNKKILDDRDPKEGGDWDYEQIASNVIAAIKEDPEPWFSADKDGHGVLNPTGLVRSVGIVQLTPERAGQLLQAVQTAWSDHLRATVPALLRIKIKEAL